MSSCRCGFELVGGLTAQAKKTEGVLPLVALPEIRPFGE
jgi:hypothetical protein